MRWIHARLGHQTAPAWSPIGMGQMRSRAISGILGPRLSLAILFVAALVSACATDPTSNKDPTCLVTSPPATSGEGGAHAQLYQVYPRRAAIDEGFNGCQTLWLHSAGEAGASKVPIEQMRLYFIKGKVVAVRIENAVCGYSSSGAPLAGNRNTCPAWAPEGIPSQPAGCIAKPHAAKSIPCDDDV